MSSHLFFVILQARMGEKKLSTFSVLGTIYSRCWMRIVLLYEYFSEDLFSVTSLVSNTLSRPDHRSIRDLSRMVDEINF